ncbi:MAG: hypothetical protein WC022_02940 [Parcubacteria group bacterium]
MITQHNYLKEGMIMQGKRKIIKDNELIEEELKKLEDQGHNVDSLRGFMLGDGSDETLLSYPELDKLGALD